MKQTAAEFSVQRCTLRAERRGGKLILELTDHAHYTLAGRMSILASEVEEGWIVGAVSELLRRPAFKAATRGQLTHLVDAILRICAEE